MTESEKIEWGPEIAVDGARPEWLRGVIPCCDVKTISGWGMPAYYDSDNPAEEWSWAHSTGVANITHIRLPADHPYYLATSKGFTYWPGGDEAPADWDGGDCLYRDGEPLSAADLEYWKHNGDCADIIGYRRNAILEMDDVVEDYVLIKQMSEAEFREKIINNNTALLAAKVLGLIREETRAEKFARETGHEITPAVEAALAWDR